MKNTFETLEIQWISLRIFQHFLWVSIVFHVLLSQIFQNYSS